MDTKYKPVILIIHFSHQAAVDDTRTDYFPVTAKPLNDLFLHYDVFLLCVYHSTPPIYRSRCFKDKTEIVFFFFL